VVRKGEVKTLGGIPFLGFGSSFDAYPHTYLTAACAMGTTRQEVDRFAELLDKTLAAFKQKRKKARDKAAKQQQQQQISF